MQASLSVILKEYVTSKHCLIVDLKHLAYEKERKQLEKCRDISRA